MSGNGGLADLAVKIRVSYEWPEELQQVLDMLGKGVEDVRTPRQQAGRYKKAYIDFDGFPCMQGNAAEHEKYGCRSP